MVSINLPMNLVHRWTERDCMADGLYGCTWTYSAAARRTKASSLHAEQAVKRKAEQHQMSY